MRSPSMRSIAAVTFAGLDREAVRFARQPLHACRIAVRRSDRLGHAVTLELDAISRGCAGERARGVQILDRDLVGTVRAGELEIRSFGSGPAAEPRVRRRARRVA